MKRNVKDLFLWTLALGRRNCDAIAELVTVIYCVACPVVLPRKNLHRSLKAIVQWIIEGQFSHPVKIMGRCGNKKSLIISAIRESAI